MNKKNYNLNKLNVKLKISNQKIFQPMKSKDKRKKIYIFDEKN